MSKGYKTKSKEPLIEKIYAIARSSENQIYRRDAGEMVEFYIRNGFLPTQMKMRAREIIGIDMPEAPKQEKQARLGRHYLYAVMGEGRMKLGYSTNPKGRLRSLQVASCDTLKLVWQTYAGDDENEAKRQEKKLHRTVRQFRIKGEWYDPKCLYQVKMFRVRNESAREERLGIKVNQELDREFAAIIG